MTNLPHSLLFQKTTQQLKDYSTEDIPELKHERSGSNVRKEEKGGRGVWRTGGRAPYPQCMELPQCGVLCITVLWLLQLRQEHPTALRLVIKQQICPGKSLQHHMKRKN